MTQQDDWRIGRRAGVCAGCGTSFLPGSEVGSGLYRAEGGFERRDWCSACFGDAAKRGEPYSWWAGQVPPPDTRKAVFDLGVAREFLRRLLREEEPSRASLRYLLVLLLLRKKAVNVLEQFTDSRGEVMVVALPPDETPHEVLCPVIDEAEAATLRDELGRLFQLA